MTIRITFKDKEHTTKIYPCVEDLTVGESILYIYRAIPDRGRMIEQTEQIKRKEVYRMEVSGL